MRDLSLYAEYDMLTKRLVKGGDLGMDWAYLSRSGMNIPTGLLRYLHKNTTGLFAIGHKYIAFEKEEDAIMYRIAYPE